MQPTIRYTHDNAVYVYLKPTNYVLGNGRNQVQITFLPMQFEAFFDVEFGDLSYKYVAKGGWQSNRKAMSELRQLERLGLKISSVYIQSNYSKRCKFARSRFVRYSASGVEVKTAKPVAM